MDPIKTIGKFISGAEQRDAIHIAILPALATEDLSPGEYVKLVYGTTNQIRSAPENESVGIVDPFLTEWPTRDRWVWVFLHPNSITGIRHEWTHPKVDNLHIAENESELWLHQFADRWNFNYNEMIESASRLPGNAWENYIVAQGRDLHSRNELGEDHDLFWHHLQKLTNKKFDQIHREKFGWSCSC